MERVRHERGLPITTLGTEWSVLALKRGPLGEFPRRDAGQKLLDRATQLGR